MGTRIEFSFGATLLVLATACGGGGDTGAVAGLPEYVIDELPPLVVASDRKGECSGGSTDCYYAASDAKPADLSCLRDYTFAKEGDLRTHTIEIGDFFIGDPIPDLCVNVYPDNVVPEEDECGDTFTNASGVVSFEAPENATIAY
ncbi:MAG: hypothetical protein KC417_09575, partial [Myxococcales bacterium]|nr:hypothetical protein [Myxococcales bacterium]